MGAAGAPAGLLLLVRWSDQTMRRDPGLSMRKYHRKNGRIGLDRGLLDHLREVPVHGRVVGELGVKRGYDDGALAGHHAFPAVHDERRDGRPEAPYAGRPDEHHLERLDALAEVRLPFRLEALLLSAVGIALRGDVDETERGLLRALHFAREEDQTGAGAHDGLARGVKLLERGHEAPLVEELEERRALSPGHDEASDLVELPRQPDLDRLKTEPVERLAVQVEVALEGEHADDHAVARSPRTTSRASAAGRTP